MFTNDLFKNGKLGGNVKNWKKTLIGNKVLIGSNATILPVSIVSGCVIGAGIVVKKDLNPNQVIKNWANNPQS